MLILINVKRIEFLNIVGGHLSHSHKSWEKKNLIKQLSWSIIGWKLFRIWTLWLVSCSKLNLMLIHMALNSSSLGLVIGQTSQTNYKNAFITNNLTY